MNYDEGSGIMPIKGESLMRHSKRGFTLVELIVVIVIIGILSSVIIINYKSFIDKAKFSNNQVLLDDIVKTLNIIEIKEETDIKKITKAEFIPLYNKNHFGYINLNRFYDLGLDENGELLIIVLYKDLYTVYNYDSHKYTNHKEETAISNLIVGYIEEEDSDQMSFELLDEPISIKRFSKFFNNTTIKCYLYQDGDYCIYFDQDLIDRYIGNNNSDIEKVESIIENNFVKELEGKEQPDPHTYLVYLHREGLSYCLYQEGQEDVLGNVSQITLKLFISS